MTPLLTDIHRRVILVGRTGLDHALRTLPDTELVRAATSLHAIGELADPAPGLEDASPVVVVGRLPQTPDPAARPDQLVAALRTIDPNVRVLATTDAHRPDAYEAALSPAADPASVRESLLAALRRPPSTSETPQPVAQGNTRSRFSEQAPADSVQTTVSAPEHTQTTDHERPADPDRTPIADTPPTPRPGTAPDPDAERELIDRLLKGRPIRHLALRHLSGIFGVDLRAHDTDPTLDDPASEDLVAPVVLARDDGRSAPACWLTAPSGAVSPEHFAAAASRLADWLRLEAQQRELRHAAFTDPLTGAWNRRYFDRYLSAAFEQARAARLPVTVLVFDIDHFKSYNDRFGHAAGDEILRETVSLLRSCIRPTDRVCRIGGDEFAVIFYEPAGPRAKGSAPPLSVYSIAKRFQQQICAHNFPKLGECVDETLTVSAGLATFPWDGSTPDELLDAADKLSLASKEAGKNAITLGVGAERVCKLVDTPPNTPPNTPP
ncbi:MAG: diguanylate cyclase, partial [Phycisphaerales bacterium JB040]